MKLHESQVLAAIAPPWRSRFVIALVGFAFALLAVRALYLATNPIMKLRAQLVTVNSPQQSLLELVQQSERLAQMSKNIENISIAELRAAMNQAVTVAERAAIDFNAQSRAWSELRGKIREDNSTYETLRVQLADLQRVQRDEIVRLKSLLDEAQKPSLFADALNLTLSFILGVLSSLLASFIYERRKRDA